MYDASKLLNRFYNEKLRLGRDGRARLAKLRDTNLDRLKSGLEKLGPIRGASKATFESHLDQGSYAMHTLNQHPDDDYDIDTGVIFDESVLPASALDSRKRVAEALLQSGATFLRDPEARTNAVTVWYAEGHHVDLAVYRRTAKGLEHAGADWTARDPSEVTQWFTDRVNALSPFWLIDVERGQLRRIVRFVKRFCASRRSWSLPGGMIATTLVTEVYQHDPSRDDVSLRKTLIALRDRLVKNQRVFSPVDAAQELTGKPQTEAQVRRLQKRLDDLLPKLDVLDDRNCDEATARTAWNSVFRHDFFVTEQDTKTDATTAVNLTIRVAQHENGPLREASYRSSQPPLPKGMWLRFEVAHELKRDDVVRWTVKNEGDEAEAAADLGHTREGRDLVTWRHTRFRGDHTMRCEIVRNGRVIATANRKVRVA